MTSHLDGPIVIGKPMVECEALTAGEPRQVAVFRCTGCRESFAHLVATAEGAVLIYWPVLWEHPEFAWWRETGPDAKPGHVWRLLVGHDAGACQWRAPHRYALLLDQGPYDLGRAVLACKCRRRPHIADPAALRSITTSGGAGVLPGLKVQRQVIPVAAGECIDGLHRELFAKSQRRRYAT